MSTTVTGEDESPKTHTFGAAVSRRATHLALYKSEWSHSANTNGFWLGRFLTVLA